MLNPIGIQIPQQSSWGDADGGAPDASQASAAASEQHDAPLELFADRLGPTVTDVRSGPLAGLSQSQLKAAVRDLLLEAAKGKPDAQAAIQSMTAAAKELSRQLPGGSKHSPVVIAQTLAELISERIQKSADGPVTPAPALAVAEPQAGAAEPQAGAEPPQEAVPAPEAAATEATPAVEVKPEPARPAASPLQTTLAFEPELAAAIGKLGADAPLAQQGEALMAALQVRYPVRYGRAHLQGEVLAKLMRSGLDSDTKKTLLNAALNRWLSRNKAETNYIALDALANAAQDEPPAGRLVAQVLADRIVRQ